MRAFQEAIRSAVLAEDGLTVLGRGLGLHSILAQLIRIYSAEGTAPAVAAADGGPQQALVFVLNVGRDQQEQLQEDLSTVSGAFRPIRFVNQEVGTSERAKVYLEGGCVIATAPILIVDCLNGRVNAKHISGLIVNDAHRVSDTSREAFIVRLFRTSNQSGFVKAFSEQPELLSGEFGKVEKILKSLFLRKLFLWPRFHLVVADSISAHNPEVIELLQPTTPLMSSIQRAIMDTMEACLAELRTAHSGDLAHLTVEDGLSRAFDKSVRNQLRSVWNKVSKKTRQLVDDLGVSTQAT
jgi:DNA excision repair protein ERCC-4